MNTFGLLIGSPVADVRAALTHLGYQVTTFGYQVTPDCINFRLWQRDPDGELFDLLVVNGVVIAFERWTKKPASTIDPTARRKR